VIRELEKKLVLLQFFSNKDKDFVLQEGPWSFDGYILLLNEWTGHEQLSDIEFYHAQFWVKAYDIPAMRQTLSFARVLGDKIGSFLGCEMEDMNGADRSLCFRVNVDIRKPLRRGISVKINEKSLWIYFKYIKLLDFCYGCGRVGHVLKAWDEVDPDTPAEALQYGPWLRGSPLKSRRRNAEPELHEERRLFEAFRRSKAHSKARHKLVFDAIPNPTICAVGGSDDATTQMLVDEDPILSVSNEIFKRKLEGNPQQQASVRTRQSTTIVPEAAVAEQPRLNQ